MVCPVWNSGLTLQEVSSIKQVQIRAMAVIRAENRTTYSREALYHFKLKNVSDRHEELCLKFAVKASKNPMFSKWFTKNTCTVNTRSEKLPLLPIRARTKRFRNSPLP